MIYAEILAGGPGKRFGNQDLPKQYNMLGSKPIIIHTLEQFILNPKFDKIIVCVPKEWINYTEDLIAKYIKQSDNIDVVQGGVTRNETIMSGLKHIEEKYGLSDKDVVVITGTNLGLLMEIVLNPSDRIDPETIANAIELGKGEITECPKQDLPETSDDDFF